MSRKKRFDDFAEKNLFQNFDRALVLRTHIALKSQTSTYFPPQHAPQFSLYKLLHFLPFLCDLIHFFSFTWWALVKLKIAAASRYRKSVIKFLSLWGRGLHSSEAAFFLLTQRPRVRFSTSPKIYCYDVEIYTWPWLEKSRLRLENVDQTHLVLASGKLVLRKSFSRSCIKSEDQHWFYFLRMEKRIKNLRHPSTSTLLQKCNGGVKTDFRCRCRNFWPKKQNSEKLQRRLRTGLQRLVGPCSVML